MDKRRRCLRRPKKQRANQEGVDFVYKESGVKAPTFETWKRHWKTLNLGVDIESCENGRISCSKQRPEDWISKMGRLDEPSE